MAHASGNGVMAAAHTALRRVRRMWSRAQLLLLLALSAASCRREITILAVNDVYRIEGLTASDRGGMARIRALRDSLERAHGAVLFLHGGDFVAPSLISRTFKGHQMIDVLNRMDGNPDAMDERMYVVFGNHEFDADDEAGAVVLDELVAASQFRWFRSNIEFRDVILDDGRVAKVDDPRLLRSAMVEVGSIRIGLFSHTLDTPGIPYADFRDAPETRDSLARAHTAALRGQGADIVIALTHQSHEADIRLLANGGNGPDFIFGGHDHAGVIDTTVDGSGWRRYLFRADADANTATVVRIVLSMFSRQPIVHAALVSLDAASPKDTVIDQRVKFWEDRHAVRFCGERRLHVACLDDPFARVPNATLVGEELRLRSDESNLGSWVTGKVKAYADSVLPAGAATVAVINSGALRLNQDLPPNAVFMRRHLEELIQYDGTLHVKPFTGAALREVLTRSLACRGEGAWLQISGFSFEANAAGDAVTRIRLDGTDTDIDDTTPLRLVTTSFLADRTRGQDGYGMLNEGAAFGVITRRGDTLTLKSVITAGLGPSAADSTFPTIVLDGVDRITPTLGSVPKPQASGCS